MKKSFLLPLLAALILGGCGNSAGPGSDIYTAGVYYASAPGFQDAPLNLSVEFSAVKILEITIGEHGETKTRDEVIRALNRVPKQIKETQSADVDVVSGATKASNAIIAAVKDCIAQAKINGED
jgi:fumarate reductase flavoprotein subunit